METQSGQTVSVVDDSKKDEIRDSEQSFSLLLPVKSGTLSKQYPPTSETVIKDKDQRSKSFVSDRREKRSCRETDIMPVGYNYIVDIKLEEEVLIKGVSKKEVQSMRKRKHDVALQNTLQPECRKRRRESSSLEVGSQRDIVTEKKCTSSLLESEQKIQSFTKNTKKLKKNCQHSLIMRGLHKEMKTLTEKDGASVIIGLGSDKVSRNLQKSHSCSASESRPQQKMWNFRERIKPVWPEQNQDKSQRVKRSIPKLESTIQNLSLLKHRERKRVITSPKTQVDVKYPVRVRSAAVPHLSSKCTEGTENLMKNARVSLVKPQEQKRKKENSFMKLTVSKSQKGVKASNQNSKHLLESVVNFEENKKCRSTVIGINRMVTRAFSKSKMCTSDGEKQSWKSEKSVTEILGCRQWILEKKMTREQMDCVPTEELLVTKTEGTSKEETDGKDEIVTSTVLKKEIKTSREDTLDILSIRYGKLTNTIVNTLKDCNIETPLKQAACLPITESDEIKSNNSISPYFWRETKIYCDANFSVTNNKCPEHFDIKVAEKKIEKNALVEYQGERFGWLPMHNVLPCNIKKIPVVKLFDCYYIKALLESTGIKSTQSYTVHCGSLHVTLDQGKSLSSRGMGPNDVNSSPNVIHAIKLLPQKDILVSKKMCQYSKKCQNGKQFRENKLSTDFKKPSKRLKMPEDLEESAVMKVLINVDISSEHGIPIEDNTVAIDSSVILEKLNSSETSDLSLLDYTPELSLQQPSQNQVANLSSNETANQEHFITYSSSIFEKSAGLKKENELKQMETFTDLSKMDENKSIVEGLDSEKNMFYNSNTAACKKRKRTCEIKVNKAGSKQQLYSCQRAVPINGKNIWPHESCARTSLWVHKNHALDSERESLRGTDSVTKCRELEVHKLLADSSKISADKIVHHKIECTVESPLSDCMLHVGKTLSAITGTENRFSDHMEKSKHSTYAATKLVKSKVILNSLGREVKGKKNINIQNGIFADTRKKKTDNPKISDTKQEPVLKTLMIGTLSNFKIPLLKDKSDFRKPEVARSSEKNTCNLSSILENSVKKARIKETSSAENPCPQIQTEQMNSVPVQKKYTNQFSDIPENIKKRSIRNTFERTSHESKLELPTLKAAPFSLSTGNIEKQMLKSTLASETIDTVNFNNKLAQDKDNICADILKAYEDDVLVIDVIQDDPDLFGDTDEQEGVCTKIHNKNICTSGFSENLELKSESSQLPKSRHLKCVRDSLIQDYGTLKSDVNAVGLLIKVDEIKSESLSGNSSIGIITESSIEDGQLTESDELTEVFDTNEKHEFSEKLLAMQEQKTSVQGFVKTENTLTIEPLSCDQPELPFPTVKAIVPQRQDTALKSWMNDFRFPRKCPPCPSSTTNSYETWKVEKNSVTNLGLAFLPRGYCRYHFNSLNGCERPNCRYWHVLLSGNEKLCNEIIKKYINIGEVVLLQRAVHIFTDYYKEGTTGVHLDSQTFHDLLTSLLQSSLLKELFHVVHTGIMIKILPTVDILLKIFEEVASMKVREAVPELSDIFCKLIDTGMVLECEHIGYITKLLNQLHVSNQEITILMSRFQRRHFHKANFCDFDSAVAEFQHCKEKSDWAKLGTLYVNVKRACKNVDNLEKYSLYVASVLISSVKEEKPGIPFCEFAAAVNADAHRDEGDMTSLGRIGISVMFSYYKIHQWSKAKKVLDVLHALKIHFTFFKGFLGQEQLASRCHIVNVAVEIFLKCGSLDGALWVLRESEWIISSASWPCDRMDVLNRHNLLYTIASELMTKNRYGETFEVLRNLPGFQNTCDTLDVSQYSLLFNKLLSACSESRNTGLSSAVVEFMLARNIPVEFNLLRALITALGRSCLWLKARTHYKSALALGCYPPPEGNLYRKLLLIPSYMTEVEMLLAIEIFLVSNASSIQSPGASSQILQIVLKRCEGNDVRNNEDYQNAVERLIQAARISNPKLFIKHLTVNVNMEQVYSLEHTCVLKWLKENMKWAGKVWLF